jgi:hypothetical protein
MLLNLGSFVLILLIAGYYTFYLYQKKELLTQTAGMIAISTLSVLSSLVFGAIAAQTFDFDLRLSMGIAILLAIIIAVPGGRLFGLKSAINAVLASVASGVLGTVVGSLFYKSNRVILVADIVFILGAFLVQKTVDWRLNASNEKRKTKKVLSQKPSYVSTVTLSVIVVTVVGYVLLQHNQISIGVIGQPTSQMAAFDEDNNLQLATIDVTASGFVPKSTELKAYTMLKAVFNVKSNAGSGLKLISQDLGISADLKIGDNIFLLNNPQPGTYEFIVESKDSKKYKGTLIVKADQ